MSTHIKMPLVVSPETVGQITRVYRQKDFYVDVGDPLVEVRIGVHTVTVGSPEDGVVQEMRAWRGGKVRSDDQIAIITGVGAYDGIYNHGRFANAVFVSYRHSDSPGHTGRIYDSVSRDLGHWHVFRDIGSLKPGRDFVQQVRLALGSTRIMIVVVGRGWLAAADASGARRLEDPTDLHRIEIRTVLERQIPVIPVLVGGAPMPKPEALPEDIRQLARRKAIEITDERWEYDAQRLSEAVAELLEESRRTFVPALESGDRVFHETLGSGIVERVQLLSTGQLAIDVTFDSGEPAQVLVLPEAAKLRRTGNR